jgi:hypothetical protein
MFVNTVACVGNDVETNHETTSAARQQILNKQLYTAVTE